MGRWINRDPIDEDGGKLLHKYTNKNNNEWLNLYGYVKNSPIDFYDVLGLANVGDVIFFNWSTNTRLTWPRHAAIVTCVTKDGKPLKAFGAWGDTMTFHEVDLKKYNGGIEKNIIGEASMDGLNSQTLKVFIKLWNGRSVAPDWDGSKGYICIDAVTATDGYGGDKIRKAMAADYKGKPKAYKPIPITITTKKGQEVIEIHPNPEQDGFYRKNPWAQQFFINTGKYQSYR